MLYCAGLVFNGTLCNAAEVTLGLRGGIISFQDTLDDCMDAALTNYTVCGKIECQYAERLCFNVFANIAPAGDDGIDRSILMLPDDAYLIETEIYE